MFATVDPLLENAQGIVTNLFHSNLPAILAAVFGIMLMLWLFNAFLRSLAISKPGGRASAGQTRRSYAGERASRDAGDRFVRRDEDGSSVWHDRKADGEYRVSRDRLGRTKFDAL